MQRLTDAEEQVMRYLWAKKEAFVKELVECYPEPRPAYNTVSTIIRILEKKGWVDHDTFGRTHRYRPLRSQEEYLQQTSERWMKTYFGDSPKQMLSFFLKNKQLTTKELDALLKELNDDE